MIKQTTHQVKTITTFSLQWWRKVWSKWTNKTTHQVKLTHPTINWKEICEKGQGKLLSCTFVRQQTHCVPVTAIAQCRHASGDMINLLRIRVVCMFHGLNVLLSSLLSSSWEFWWCLLGTDLFSLFFLKNICWICVHEHFLLSLSLFCNFAISAIFLQLQSATNRKKIS